MMNGPKSLASWQKTTILVVFFRHRSDMINNKSGALCWWICFYEFIISRSSMRLFKGSFVSVWGSESSDPIFESVGVSKSEWWAALQPRLFWGLSGLWSAEWAGEWPETGREGRGECSRQTGSERRKRQQRRPQWPVKVRVVVLNWDFDHFRNIGEVWRLWDGS